MNNNQYKGGNTRTRGPNRGTHQQPRRSDVYVDLRRDGNESIFVQRSDLVSSNAGLKAKGYVDNGRQGGKSKGSNSNFNLRSNQTVTQVKPAQTFGNSSRDANNSSGKKSYFEPYDHRRTSRVQNNASHFNYAQPVGRRTGHYSQPQFGGFQHAGFYQQGYQNPTHRFHQIQHPNSVAAAIAPNGQTIFIPLDNTQYEIKKDNHDLYDQPTGRDLFALESERDFESNIEMDHSPRPVDLKGGLSQDSEYDSDASFDERTSCDSDVDSRAEGSSDESEFVDNCISDVLKTIANSVQNMTVEESENIVQRAIKKFEDGEEYTEQPINTKLTATVTSTKSKPISDDNAITQGNTTATYSDSKTASAVTTQVAMTNELNETEIKSNSCGVNPDVKCDNDNIFIDDASNTNNVTVSKDLCNTDNLDGDLIDLSEKIDEEATLLESENTNDQSTSQLADMANSVYVAQTGTDHDTLGDKFFWSETLERTNFESKCNRRFKDELQEKNLLDSTLSQGVEMSNSQGDEKESSDIHETVADTIWYDQREADVNHNKLVPPQSPLESSNVSSIPNNEIDCSSPFACSNTSMRMPEQKPEVVINNPSIYQHECFYNSCSPVQVQNEWLLSEQSTNLDNTNVSPRDYTKASNAVFIPGEVIIDGQGFFTSPNFQAVPNQSLYMADSPTFEQVVPPGVQSMAPPYTFFIHDTCPPPASGVLFEPVNEAVTGDLVDLTTALPYESKMYEVSQSTGNNAQQYTIHQQSPANNYMYSPQSSVYIDQQCYSPMQLPSPVQGSCVMNDTQTMLGTNITTQHQQMPGNMLAAESMVGANTYPTTQDGHFFVSYDEESVFIDPQTGLSYPAIHLTDDCLLTVIFRENVCLEISIDKSMRLVHHDRKLVAAINSNGEETCLIHPAARIHQSGTSLDAALYSNRKATMNEEYVVFGNGLQSYKFDHMVVLPVKDDRQFKDLSNDESIKFMTNDDARHPDIEHLKQQAFEILAHAHFYKHGERGSTVIINGIKAVQSDKGDVSVYCGPIKFIRMNPSRSILRVKTQLFEADIESNWNVKLTRGHLALNVSHLGFIVSNGKIKSCIDQDDKLQSFSLPDHRVLMLGQALPQHRPGVPLRSRRRIHNRKLEPEGDHVGYSMKIQDPN